VKYWKIAGINFFTSYLQVLLQHHEEEEEANIIEEQILEEQILEEHIMEEQIMEEQVISGEIYSGVHIHLWARPRKREKTVGDHFQFGSVYSWESCSWEPWREAETVRAKEVKQ
jgi:hypothetical protein